MNVTGVGSMIPDHYHEATEKVVFLISKRGIAVQRLYIEGKAWLEDSAQPGEVLKILLESLE